MKTYLFFRSLQINGRSFCTLLSLVLFSFSISAQVQDYLPLGNPIIGTSLGEMSNTALSSSADGTTIAIGTPDFDNGGLSTDNYGMVRIFSLLGTDWVQKGQSIIGDSIEDACGESLDMSPDGNSVIIGFPNSHDNGAKAGKTIIYDYDGSAWVQRGNSILGLEGDRCGTSVNFDVTGNIVAISYEADMPPNYNDGFVRIFSWNGTSWVQIGTDIIGSVPNDDQFGKSIALSGDGETLIIGIPAGSTNSSGVVRVYAFDGANWQQRGPEFYWLVSMGGLGTSVDISEDGNTIAFSGAGYLTKGSVFVYDYDGTTWVLKGEVIEGDTQGYGFGFSISMNNIGDVIAVGIPYDSDLETYAGRVKTYQFVNNAWQLLASDLIGQNESDYFGYSVNLNSSGERLLVSATMSDANRSDFGQVNAYSYDGVLSIFEHNALEFSVAPNPTNGVFKVSFDYIMEHVDLKIYNVLGEIIMAKDYVDVNRIESTLVGESGIYFVNISTLEGKSTTLKLIKH